MIKKILSFYVASSLLLGVPVAVAQDDERTLNLPSRSLERLQELEDRLADNVISLGTKLDKISGKMVEGYAIVHYKERPARIISPSHLFKSQCYGFLATGAKWKTVEPWVLNPVNASGLNDSFLLSNLTADIAKWEDATDGIVGNSAGVNILGNGTLVTSTLVADTSSPDGKNEVYFANISDPGAIAVTIVWGRFSGPSWWRELVEWDQIYDDYDFAWSASGAAGAMDFENIATHELGHSVGLADLYTSSCSEETMYGYGSYGETKKQTLNTGDIAGINKLY